MQISFQGSNLKHRLALLPVVMFSVLLFPLATVAQEADQVQRLRLVDTYLRSGQFERAVSLLEDLRHVDDYSIVVYERLRQAYEGLKQYDAAIDLVDDMLEREPSPALMAEKAALYYLAGDEEQAFLTWDRAIAMSPHDRSTYRVVYFSLVQNRLIDRAIEVLLEARTILEDSTLYQMDLGHLHGILGNYEQAMDEYLGMLETDDRQVSFVKSRLSSITEQPEARKILTEVAERAVRREPLNRGFREIAAWLYIENGDFRKAFDATRAIDRLEDEHGRLLFDFAQTAASAGAYDVAGEAYREILTRHPNSPVAPNVQYSIGHMFERQAISRSERAVTWQGERADAPHYQAALEAYTEFIEKNHNHGLMPEAMLAVGRLQREVFRDLDSAQEVLGHIVERFPQSEAALQARFDMGTIAVQREELSRARLIFSRIVDDIRTGDIADRARYEIALLDFYNGQFETALSRLRAMTENTSSDVANNAIELTVLLQENFGTDTVHVVLQKFADAMLLKRRQHYGEAINHFDALIVSEKPHTFVDDARFQRALLLRELGQIEDALLAFSEIPVQHPTSHLAERSLMQVGEINELEFGDIDAAIEAYSELLMSYPGSLLAPEARVRIRRLRGDGV